MKKAPKTMMNFAIALILLVIAIQVAWAIIAPIIGYVILVVVAIAILYFAVPRIYNALKESGNLRP